MRTDGRGPQWPSRERRPEREPGIDTAERAAPLPVEPDPESWGVTADEAREMLARQMCPVCGEGPWKSPLNHVSKRHAINRLVMRDVCGLSMTCKVTDEDTRKRWSENGARQRGTLAANAEAVRGTTGRKSRLTAAAKAAREDSAIERWARENPERVAEVRAGFKERVSTPEARAKWAESMAAVREQRVYTQEEREEFAQRMSSPEVVARRESERAARTTLNCSVDGCDRAHVARGYCKLHWRRWKKTGDVGGVEPLDPAEASRKGRPTARVATPDQFQEVRRLCAGGMSQHKVAERMGISQSIVSRIVRGAYKQ